MAAYALPLVLQWYWPYEIGKPYTREDSNYLRHISVEECKHMFMFLLKNLACKELTYHQWGLCIHLREMLKIFIDLLSNNSNLQFHLPGANELMISKCTHFPSRKCIPIILHARLWPFCLSLNMLTNSGLVTPYGDIDLCQHWFRQCLAAWRHQAITCTNVDLVRSIDIHTRAILQEVTWPSITWISVKTYPKFHSNLPGGKELITNIAIQLTQVLQTNQWVLTGFIFHPNTFIAIFCTKLVDISVRNFHKFWAKTIALKKNLCWGIPCQMIMIRKPLDYFTVPLHSHNGRHLPAIRALQGNYQRPLEIMEIPAGHMSSEFIATEAPQPIFRAANHKTGQLGTMSRTPLTVLMLPGWDCASV